MTTATTATTAPPDTKAGDAAPSVSPARRAALAAAAAAGVRYQQRQPLDAEFAQRIRDLDARVRAIGVSWSQICRATGTARATPDRWLRRVPKSVETMAAMEKAIADAEAEARADKF